MTTVVRSGVFAAVLLSVAACTPKGPAPLQCTSDANCFAGGVCNAGGTCVTGAAIDAAKSTIDISQSTAVADGQDEVTITVTVRDAAGNPLSSRGVRLSVDGSNNTLTQPSLSTNSVGQVTGKLTSTKAEPKTIHAVAGTVISSGNSPGVALSKTATVNFVADQKNVACLAGATGCSLDATKASSIKITADDGVSPPVVEVDTAKGIRIHLVVRDANGNLIANAPVTITPVGKDLVVKPAVGTTASDGSFTATVTSTVAQEATILVDVAGLHAVQVVTFNPGLIDPAHSPLAAYVGAVDPNNECDSDVPHDAICTIAAGTTDKVTITLLARDRFDNIVQDAEVWFSAPAGNENSGNTVAPDAFETRYCGDKSPPANCEGIRNAPLLTMPDGTVTASFVATKAGSDGVDIHIIDASGDKVVSLPVQVTAGNPNVSMSYFVVVGAADGTPTPADDSHNFAVIAYVADAFDNPIAGVPIAFSTLLCTATSGDPCSSTAAKPTGDTITPTQLPDSGKTDEAGLYSAFYSAQLTGWRQVSVTGGAVTTPQETLFVPGDPASSPTAMTLTLGTVSADPGHPTHVSVVLKDKFGNATPNQNLTIDAKNGTSATGTSCAECTFTFPTYDSGTATYAADLTSSKAGTYTITADVDLPAGGTVHIDDKPLTVTPGGVNPGISIVEVDPVTPTSNPLTANGTAHANVRVTLLDTQNNAVSGVTPLIGVSPSNGVVVGTVAPTDSAGRTSFSFTSTVAETKTVAVALLGTPGPKALIIALFTLAQTVPFTFVPGSPSPGNSSFVASPSTISDDGASGSSLSVTVLDANNNPVPGLSLTFSTNAPASKFTFNPATPVTTDANGVAKVTYASNATAATYVITAAGTGFSKTVNVAVAGKTADPAFSGLTIASPATVGTTAAFTATEKTGSSNPVVGHTVTVACSPSATVAYTGSNQVTDAGGQVTGTVTTNAAGTLRCTAADTTGGGVTFAAANVTFNADSAHPSPTNTSALSASPSAIIANFSQTSGLSLVVRDGIGSAGGNVAPGVLVSFSSSDLNDAFTCSSGCATNSAGIVATAVKSKVTGIHTITATIPVTGGSPFTKQTTITVNPGSPSKVSFKKHPADASSTGVMLQVQVEIDDAFGNLVSNVAPTPVTLTLRNCTSPTPVTAGNPGTLFNNIVYTQSGVATFNFLFPSNTAGGVANDSTNSPCRTIHGAASNVTGEADSNVFHITVPNASTGGNGAFHATTSVCPPPGNLFNGVCVLPAGVYNYTSFVIDSGVTVAGDGNGILDLRATTDVTISGVLSVSGGAGSNAFFNSAGRGGGPGNVVDGAVPTKADDAVIPAGGNCRRVSDGVAVNCTSPFSGMAYGLIGGGPFRGSGGSYLGGGGGGGSALSEDYNSGGGGGGGGYAGGAGGFAGADGCVQAGGAGGGLQGGATTPCGQTGLGGGQACKTQYLRIYTGGDGAIGGSACTPIAGSGGGGSIGCDAANDLSMTFTLRPGSGGGGGGNGGDNNGNIFEPGYSGGGGGGGGGGGALRITTPTRIVLGTSGKILANGGRGGNGFLSLDDCNDDSGGAGGGGSGGAIWLQAPVITVPSGAVVAAAGGPGGAAGATTTAGPGGSGTVGRVRLSTDTFNVGGIVGGFTPSMPSVNGTTGVANNAAGKTYVGTYGQ